MNIFVDDAHIDCMSRDASLTEVATYLATYPTPGQQSVNGKSLSIVFGI